MNPHVDTATGSGLVRLACIQMQPGFGEVASNVAKSVQLVERAANRGANLVVLPELCNSGYVFANRAIAPGNRPRQQAVFINQCAGQAVHFQLG